MKHFFSALKPAQTSESRILRKSISKRLQLVNIVVARLRTLGWLVILGFVFGTSVSRSEVKKVLEVEKLQPEQILLDFGESWLVVEWKNLDIANTGISDTEEKKLKILEDFGGRFGTRRIAN